MKGVQLAPEAVAELNDATAWYASRQSELADRFLDEFERMLAWIAARPSSFPRLRDLPELPIHRALLPRFPYAIVFLEFPGEIRILAVAHVKRQPNYWLNRVTEES